MIKMTRATKLELHALCPACDSDLTNLSTRTDGRYENGTNRGEGAFVLACESCGMDLAVTKDIVTEAQHACLVLLGEA